MFEQSVASTAGEVAVAREHVITKRSVGSWVVYDLANTVFSMGVVSLFFPVLIQESVGREREDFALGLITSISMGIIFVLSPFLGALTDRARRRMPFLVVSTLLAVTCTVFLARGAFLVSVILFIVGNAAYQAGLQFYDAMLPDVSTESNRGKIGGIGVGIGYLGSFIAVGYTFIIKADSIENLRVLFLLVAVSFLVFAIPCFLFVRERGNPHPKPIGVGAVREVTTQTVATFRAGHKYPGLIRFLVGRIFYTDAINTVINIMLLYTVTMAMDTAGLNEADARELGFIIMATAITFAVVGGFTWGWLADRLGPKRTLNHVLRGWVLVFGLAAAVGIFALPLWVLFVVACSAGFVLGGIWAADRPYMLRLTPPARIGEFYGLYGMVGRFSAITGPLLWWIVTDIAVTQFGASLRVSKGVGVLSLLILIGTGYFILQKVSDAPREWSDEDRHPSAQHPSRGTEAAGDSG